MGWGTSFTADIYLSKKLYHSLNEIDDEIKDIEEKIEREKYTLLMYASATPKDISSDDSDIIFSIKQMIVDSVDTLHELYVELYNLNLLKNAVEDGNYKFGQDSV